jgi:uncharacterized protein YsxB (DUF464 family)
MTRIEFFNQGGRITGFSCHGHSGYAEAGADIVCAAVTSAIRLAECILSDVLGENIRTRVKEDEARITLQLPATCEEEDTVQAVLTGLMLTLSDLRDEYPDHIEVLEV